MSTPTGEDDGDAGGPADGGATASLGTALGELLAGGKLDGELVDRLATVDLEALGRHMRQFLPDAEVDALVQRVKALVQARRTGSPPTR